MTTLTGTMTVNAAFLREIKDDNRSLQDVLTTLRELTMKRVVLRNHVHQFVELLEDLRDKLAVHFALEEAYGYFDEAIEAAPRIAERAEQLRSEHLDLFKSIRRIADQAVQWRTTHANSANQHRNGSRYGATGVHALLRIVNHFRHFDDQLMQHEQSENVLILDAFCTDIGGEG